MTDSTQQSIGPVRWASGAVTAAGLVLCYWLRELGLHDSTAPVFFLVMAICVGFVLFVHGLGSRTGLALGVMAGFVAALGLATHYVTPMANLAVFIILATGVVGFLGHLAGGWEPLGTPPVSLNPSAWHARQQADNRVLRGTLLPAAAPVGPVRRQADVGLPIMLPEVILGAVVADFCEWSESEAGRACYADSADWSAFDQFTRTTLRERLGATGVRVFHVSSDGDRLEPLTRHSGPADQWPSTRAGLVGHAVTSGRVYVAGDTNQGMLIEGLAANDIEPLDAASGEQVAEPDRWVWLLPLRIAKRTCTLVAVRRVDPSVARGTALAEAVRNQLQLFWAHICGLQALSRFMRTDRQSGMLNRAELLSQLQEIIHSSAREGEPVMLLALAIEGLRGLDDSGRWSQRDALVQRLGHALRIKVRSDDLLGRFSDDRFIVVLRRLDSALGTLVAEKLIENLRPVLDVAQQQMATVGGGEAQCALQVRAGLAGTGLPAGGQIPSAYPMLETARRAAAAAQDHGHVDEVPLLERALGLLDYAREQRIDIATDLMSGLPTQLARHQAGLAGRPAYCEAARQSPATGTPVPPESEPERFARSPESRSAGGQQHES